MGRLRFLLSLVLCCGLLVGFGMAGCIGGPSEGDDEDSGCDERCIEECRNFCGAAGDCGWFAEDGLWADSTSCEMLCRASRAVAPPSEEAISCVVGALSECSLYEYLDCSFNGNNETKCEEYCSKLDTCCVELGTCTAPSFCSEFCTFFSWPERECFLECDTGGLCSDVPGFMTCLADCL